MHTRSIMRASKYLPIGSLGSGGMGRIDLALACGTPGAERLVVLKSVRLDYSPEEREERVRDLIWEASVAASIVHPNVIATIDLDRVGDELVVVLEYLEGVSLRELMFAATNRGGVLPQPVLFRIVRDVLAGLSHVHDLRGLDGEPLNIVHRDVSPANIFTTVNGMTKVLDFGIAKARTSTIDTPPGFVKGKLRYMAPEQLLGVGIGPRADLFAMGVILWEGLTGLPFGGQIPQETFGERLSDSCPRVSSVRPIDSVLDQIIARCLRKHADDRFTSAAELADALDNYARSHEGIAHDSDIGHLVERSFAPRLTERRAIIGAAYARLLCTKRLAGMQRSRPASPASPSPASPPTAARARARARAPVPLVVIGAVSAVVGALLTFLVK